jgi:hypothetical protein
VLLITGDVKRLVQTLSHLMNVAAEKAISWLPMDIAVKVHVYTSLAYVLYILTVHAVL